MRYLAVVIAIITISCRADDLDFRSDPAGGSVEPECLHLCEDACDAYGDWSEWTPNNNTKCEGEQFTQSSRRTRKCPHANNLCDGVTCPTEEKKTWKIYGTKKDCTDPPDPQCKQCDGCGTGQKLINKGKDNERCECNEDRGFVKKGKECVCKEGYALNVKGDACEEERKEERTCADFCTKPWGNWGEWDIPENKRCPTTNSLDKPSLTAEIATRERTRVCENNTLGCFTINVETHITPCTYCEGDDRKIIHAGTDKEECICREENRFYRDGNECVKCEIPKEIIEGKCVEPEEPPATPCKYNWGTCQSAKDPATVCEGQDIDGTMAGTLISGEADCPSTDTTSCKAKGAKATPCDSYCKWGGWKWTPIIECTDEASTAFEQFTIEQNSTRTRTCEGLCPNSNCPLIERGESRVFKCPYCEHERQIKRSDGTCVCKDGFVRKGDACVCPDGYKFNEKTDRCEEIDIDNCKRDPSCANCCGDWGGWTPAVKSCPAPSSFDKPDPITYERTRECSNDTLGCFTKNIEKHTCAYCKEDDRHVINAGTDKEECVCKDKGHTLNTQNECTEPEVVEPEATCVYTWGKCEPKQPTDTVCEGLDIDGSKTGKFTSGGANCPKTKTENCTVEGTKQRSSCDEYCTDWSTPRAWKSCPSNTALLKNPSFTDKITKTRICPYPSKAELCQPTTNCDVTMIEVKKITCECTGDGQIKNENGKCVCDSKKGFILNTKDTDDTADDTCDCRDDLILNNEGNKCVEDVAGEEPEAEDTRGDQCQTCAACPWDDWPNDGEFTFSDTNATCPSPEVFALPADQAEKKRTRSRTCNNVCDNVQCFTTNTETETCAWCQGEGQVRKGDGCVCDVSKGFYKDTSSDPPRCVSCGDDGTCVQDLPLSDLNMFAGFSGAFVRLFNTMATRCDHPYTEPGNYSNAEWMLSRRSDNYPLYCTAFNTLYDDLPWSQHEKAKFGIAYSVDPFHYFPTDVGFAKIEKTIIMRRKKDFDKAWSAYDKLYKWITEYCTKSNDCLNFLYTPDIFVNFPNAQQEHWNDYKILDDILNNSPTMRKPLMIGGNPGYKRHYGVYYEKDSFPATFRAYAVGRRDRCRQRWPDYRQLAKSSVCNPRKTGSWPCGENESHLCHSLPHRLTDAEGRQVQQRCMFARTPTQDLTHYGVRLNECFEQFWGFADTDP